MTVAAAQPLTARARHRVWSLATGDVLLPALLLIALVKGLIWTLALPPWYGPDEPSHFMYTQLLAEEGRVPAIAFGRTDGADNPLEVLCSEFNLGWRITGPFYAEPIWRADPQRCSYARTPATRRPTVLTNPAAGYTPLYYALGVPFYDLAWRGSVETRLHAVRLVSVLLGVAAAGFVYLAGLWAFGRHRRQLAAAASAVFIFQPMLSQQFAMVSNDALLFATSAFFFWRFFRALRVPLSLVDGALLGLGAGLAFLAKPNGILIAAVLPLLLWAHARLGGTWLQALRVGAVLAVLVAGCVGLGLLSNLAFDGSVFPQGIHSAQRFSVKGYFELHAGTQFARLYWLWVTGFWGYFGWFSIALPLPAFLVILGILGAAAVGLVAAFATRRFDRLVLVASVASVLVIGILTQALEAYYFRQSGTLILQGRSFMPFFAAAAIAMTAGLTALWPSRCERIAACAVAVAALSLNIFALMVLLEGFFG